MFSFHSLSALLLVAFLSSKCHGQDRLSSTKWLLDHYLSGGSQRGNSHYSPYGSSNIRKSAINSRRTIHDLDQDYYYTEPSERFEEKDDDEYYYKKSMEGHHGAELKEVSYVYPILLALLVISALFIPFISLFFFLAVSAFNCNGIGGGFSQVTPVFGRRRRRKRSPEETWPSSSYIMMNKKRLEVNNNATTKATTMPLAEEDGWDSITGFLLSDAVDAFESWQRQQQSYPSGYEFWRKQLARNTVKLAAALERFGAWINN